ncbi:hypothetical protein [Methanobrevibacter sp.]|uniref:hypothetical protein n=1 Tax=Methanobrevibacter sp. TaxID=66852 RepID=UPI003863CF4E
MSKMEIELTQEQEEKVKILMENGVTIGEAIDTLFELKEKTLPEIESIADEQLGLFDKIKETSLDVDAKAEALDENYGEADKTYELKAQEIKAKVSWAKDVFKF